MLLSRWLLLSGSTALVLLTGSFLAGSCAASAHQTLPAWSEPLDAVNEAADPAPVPGDPNPEELNSVTGQNSNYAWGHSRGWIHAPIADVWVAMRNVDVIIDRRTVAQWAVTKQNVDPTATYSFIVHNVIDNVLTVELDTEWREGAIEGTTTAPQEVAIRNEMISTSIFISLLIDTVRLVEHTDSLTEIQIERHAQNLSPTPEADIRQYQQDLFNSVVASVHGRALPTY